MSKPVYTPLLFMTAAMFVSASGDDCPYQKCQCFGDTIRCYFDELKTLPSLLPVNNTQLRILDLSGNALTEIPAGGLPPLLTSIDFQENPIKAIDKDAFNGSADTLTQLIFNGAAFTDIPRAFLRLSNLTYLSISYTQIQFQNLDVIKHIGTTLTTLILRNAGLVSWPTWIQYLPHIETLELSSASFSVPDNAFDSQINTLYDLNLESGILTDIPSAVVKLKTLKMLDLDYNNISRISRIPNSLNVLSLDNNMISDAVHLKSVLLSASVSLTDLQLSNNLLTYLPDLSAMTTLKTMYLAHNPISHTSTSTIPSSLQHLDLDRNNLQSIDSFMRNNSNLIDLILLENSIKEILGVDIPSSVQQMDISLNHITELTDESFPLNSDLRTLNLDSNPITKLSPKSFAGLTKLTYLSMAFSKITRIPLSLTYLTSAVTIELGGSEDLICTCQEKDVRSWVQINRVVINGQCGIIDIDTFINIMSAQCPD